VISPRVARFLFVGAVASGLESVRMVLARVTTVEEMTLVEAVVVDVGLERVTKREDSLTSASPVPLTLPEVPINRH